MPRKKAVVTNAAKNLKKNQVGEKWKLRFEEERRKREKAEEKTKKLQADLEKAMSELGTERQLRVFVEQKNNVSEAEVEHLSRKLADTEAKAEVLKAQCDSESAAHSSSQNQLALATKSLDEIKRLQLFRTLQTSQQTPQTAFDSLLTTNKKLEQDLKKMEEKETQKVEPIGRYSIAQSHYQQMKAVQRCVDYMKMGALTSVDYSHLVRKVASFPAFPGVPNPLHLSMEDTFILRSSLHLSDSDMRKMQKICHDRLGISLLSSRHCVADMRKELDRSENYNIKIVPMTKEYPDGRTEKINTIKYSIKDLEKGVRERLENLDKNDRLIDTQDTITLCVLTDKGADETKMCVSIENVAHPNSPNNLLLVGLYSGEDNSEEMGQNFAEIFELWNRLESITYTSKSGDTVTRKVEKKLIADLKCLSANFGHQGQGCAYPCHLCYTSWVMKGSKKLTLGSVDFTEPFVLRTLDTYRRDSISGVHSVLPNTTVLCKVEPVDVVIPTIHTNMGIFTKYFQPYINGVINCLDRKDKSATKSLKEQNKELLSLRKQEEEAKKHYEKLVRAQEESLSAAKTYRIIFSNPIMHLKHPELLCEADTCIINHLGHDRDHDEWIRCDFCQHDFHFSCVGVFAPEEKETVKHLKMWKCNKCKALTPAQHLDSAFSSYKALVEDVKNALGHYNELENRRDHLESILKRSAGDTRQKLEQFLATIDCDARTWYQSFTGNQVRRILRSENIEAIFKFLPNTNESALVKAAMLTLSQLMSFSGNKSYTDQEIDAIEETLKTFLEQMKAAFPSESVTPKMHILARHLIPFMRRHHSWGHTSEQGIEHKHAQFNSLSDRLKSVKNIHLRATLILQELTIQNWLFDIGALVD